MNIPLLTLFGVLALIVFRRVGRLPVRIWQAMTAGAIVVLLTGQISPVAALSAIDWNVMLFLFGMFVIGEALVESRYLYALAYRVFEGVRSTDGMVLALLFSAGAASALLMNDTLAIIGTPLVLRWALEHGIDKRLMLLALAFAITIGSAMSPIGNPQNLLIALAGDVPAPFLTFLGALALPTLINLLVAYGVLRVVFRCEFHRTALVHRPVDVRDPSLARLTKVSVTLILLAVAAKITLVSLPAGVDFPLSWIALVGAVPLLLFSRQRTRLLRALDWPTLMFFAAMFVLMESVWGTGVLKSLITRLPTDLTGIVPTLGISVVASQFVSNVPWVALYLPVVQGLGADVPTLLALAAGSTVAGNLLIIGAASNVIIVQRAEREGTTLSFWTFARVGIPVTLLNAAVYWFFLEFYWAP